MVNPHIPRPFWCSSGIDHKRRRTLLGLAATPSVILAPGALGQEGGSSCVLTPETGEGPFYFDPDLMRRDIRGGAEGVVLDLEVEVLRERDCAVLREARFDLWHADAFGLYSGYERQPGTGDPSPSVADKSYLRGTQFTGERGRVSFRTIYPSWYYGRTPHLHFKVFVGGDEAVSSQLYLPDEFNDRVFSTYEPYRDRAERRDTYNDDDRFMRDETGGVMCEVEQRGEGFTAFASVVIRA